MRSPMQGENSETDCFGMIASRDREEFLLDISLPSALRQSQALTGLVLVNDGAVWSGDFKQAVVDLLLPLPVCFLCNKRCPGVAGAWNTGLDWIGEHSPNAWVAMLDDDDEWSDTHIQTCMHCREGVDAVISGIRTIIGSQIVNLSVPDRLSVADFLRGNPGWQGSNTFMKLKAFRKIACFDEQLTCTHDRDLAVRFLSVPTFDYRTTGLITVSFHLGVGRDTLTTGDSKAIGLKQFWAKHKNRMSLEDAMAFKERAMKLFTVAPEHFRL